VSILCGKNSTPCQNCKQADNGNPGSLRSGLGPAYLSPFVLELDALFAGEEP